MATMLAASPASVEWRPSRTLEQVGNDGLTDDERLDCAEVYRATVLAPRTDVESAAIENYLRDRRALRLVRSR